MMKSWALAILAASITLSMVAFSTPKAMLLKMLSLKRIDSWLTLPIMLLRSAIRTSLMSVPSMVIAPPVGS